MSNIVLLKQGFVLIFIQTLVTVRHGHTGKPLQDSCIFPLAKTG